MSHARRILLAGVAVGALGCRSPATDPPPTVPMPVSTVGQGGAGRILLDQAHRLAVEDAARQEGSDPGTPRLGSR